VIGAKFFKEDLPYFVELLGEVVSKTKYSSASVWAAFRNLLIGDLAHVFHEEVLPRIKHIHKSVLGSTKDLALNSAHGLAFHRGLGVPLHPSSSLPITKYLTAEDLQTYSKVAYAKPNFAVVANGASHSDLSKWVGEFFNDCPSSAPPTNQVPAVDTSASKYVGGEERIAHDGGNTMVLAFPGSSSFTGGSYKPEIAVLAALLGGESNVKWSPGFSLLSKATASHPGIHISTGHATYSDAGLLYVTLAGNANAIRTASKDVVKTIKRVAAGEISKDDLKKAVASAKFKALESGQNTGAGLELTGAGLVQGGKAYQIDEVGQSIEKVTEDQVKKVSVIIET
jgi:ubiquinol-cytochrome c reductase core subunit 2